MLQWRRWNGSTASSISSVVNRKEKEIIIKTTCNWVIFCIFTSSLVAVQTSLLSNLCQFTYLHAKHWAHIRKISKIYPFYLFAYHILFFALIFSMVKLNNGKIKTTGWKLKCFFFFCTHPGASCSFLDIVEGKKLLDDVMTQACWHN